MLKSLLKQRVLKESKGRFIIKGIYPNIKEIDISLHYNFLGLSFLSLLVSSDTKFDEQKTTLSIHISMDDFTTRKSFLKLLDKKELETSKELHRLINEYRLRCNQLSLF